ITNSNLQKKANDQSYLVGELKRPNSVDYPSPCITSGSTYTVESKPSSRTTSENEELASSKYSSNTRSSSPSTNSDNNYGDNEESNCQENGLLKDCDFGANRPTKADSLDDESDNVAKQDETLFATPNVTFSSTHGRRAMTGATT